MNLKNSFGQLQTRSWFDKLTTNGLLRPFALSSPHSGRVEGFMTFLGEIRMN